MDTSEEPASRSPAPIDLLALEGQPRTGLARPISRSTANLLLALAGGLFLAGAVGGFMLQLLAPDLPAHPLGLTVVCSIAGVVGAAVLLCAVRDVDFIHRFLSQAIYTLLVTSSVLVTAGQYSAGPRSLSVVILYVEVPIFAFYLLPRSFAVAIVSLVGLEFAALLALQPGYPSPVSQWFFVAVSVGAIGVVFGGLLNRAVEESVRLSRLRRFLSPQVADAILSSESEAVLEPHRRQIAVFFCDLRGYTKFSGSSEPEEVVEMLGDYYEVVGGLLRNSEATIGSFNGDGIMAYFNDPVPCDDPAGKAVALAVQLRDPMARFEARWERRGFELSYGVGIAFGYATLGVVGFEGRHDYTPLGSVVNLAARLSDEAGPGEVLVDHRTYDAICDRVDAREVVLDLKGFANEIRAYRVASSAALVTERD